MDTEQNLFARDRAQHFRLVALSPDEVRFLRGRGIPIHILTPEQMNLSGCPNGSIGCTRHIDSSINVMAAAASSPVSLAVVLSHELTHCRLHDQAADLTVPSAWSRLFWRNEESKAYVAGLVTARRLQLPQLSGPLAGWWFDYLVWFWPAGSMLLSGVVSLIGFHLIVKYIKERAVRKPGASRADSAAPMTYQSSAASSAIL